MDYHIIPLCNPRENAINGRSMDEHPVQDMMRLMASKVRSIANGISDGEVDGLIREILAA